MQQLKTWVKAAGGAIALLPYQALALAGDETKPFAKGLSDVNKIGKEAGVNTDKSFETIIGTIINAFLGFLGIIFLVLMLYAGFLWMTAQGDEAKVKKAREMITQAIIGLIIIIAAFAISKFVLEQLVKVAT